ncbi:MAG: Dabb family protein [Acidobacteria bacterium]|nr:Dabb family protein [Acidobacteriota bacterium]
MIAHILLFRPLRGMSIEDRDALIAAFERALTAIPLIRRAQVGRRQQLERPYENVTREDYPFIAMLEFDNATDLGAYLDHPAHAALAERFFQSIEAALVYDFEMIDSSRVREALVVTGLANSSA